MGRIGGQRVGRNMKEPYKVFPEEPSHDSNFGLLIKMIADCMAKHGNADLKVQGITMSQAHVLMAIHAWNGESVPFKELERRLGVAQATMAGILARMEEKGLVTFETDMNDRRAKRASLTERGLEICVESERNIERGELHMTACLTDEEKERLRDYLLRVYETIKE